LSTIDSVCPDVRMAVRLSRSFKLLLLFLFLDGIEPFLAVSSPYKTEFSSIFYLGPLKPKIYSPKFFGTKSPISRLVWQIDGRCLGLPGGFRGWPIQ